MLSRVLSGAVLGIDAYLVRVEVDVANGLPAFATVGLPQGAVKEAEKRVIAAVKNSGFEVPPRRITVNLAPADIRKEGSAFDLPIAIGMLASTRQISDDSLGRFVLIGELGLDGELRPVRGALPIALAVRKRAAGGLIVPSANVAEAQVVEGLRVFGAASLSEVAEILVGKRAPLPGRPVRPDPDAGGEELLADLADVRGQEHARRAIEIAAAGSHNLLMIGPPGSGKTMLARRIPGILPPLELEEAIDTTKIHSVAGLLGPASPLIRRAPFRAPHHTISDAGLIGGGANPRPGEVSLAHNGVLFMDELPEFRRNVLEALRQPLEDHRVTIARAGFSVTYPSRIILAAAMNPCPCGYYGDESGRCTCPLPLVARYVGRVSGPLLDRIDIHLEIPPVTPGALQSRSPGEASAKVRARVLLARERQRRRFGRDSTFTANAHLRPRELREFCRLDERGEGLLRTAIGRLGLSARAFHRILRIARTIADLDASDRIRSQHVAESIQYRSLDRTARPHA